MNSNGEEQQVPPPPPSNMAAAQHQQHWYGYHQHPAQQTQVGGWVGLSVSGGAHETTDSSYSGYYSHPHHQQGQDYESGYIRDGQPANNITPSLPLAQSNTAPTNGFQNYGHGYGGYALGDHHGYESASYPMSNDHSYPQQGSESYSQNTTTYADPNAPYATADIYQNANSGDTTTYPSSANYYNSGGYQSYQTSAYSMPTNTWNDGSYGSHNYTGYAVPNATMGPAYAVPSSIPGTGFAAPNVNTSTAYSNAATGLDVGTGTNAEASLQYQQDTQQQWADYYASFQTTPQGSTDSSGTLQAAPAMLNPSVPPLTYAKVVAAEPPQQPPPPGTVQPTWLQTPVSFAALPSFQACQVSSVNVPLFSPVGVHQVPSTTEPLSRGMHWNDTSAQNTRHEEYNQATFAPVQQQTTQPQQQSVAFQKGQPALNLKQQQQQQQSRINTVHIPTNPSIVPKVGGLSATKESQKPAYVSVPVKQLGPKLSTDVVADAVLQPGSFPPSLRTYVERVLMQCKDEAQKAACQAIMKEMVMAAAVDGSLFSKDWDSEPLLPLPGTPSATTKKELSQQQANTTKTEYNLSKRLKTRWEPVTVHESDENQGRPNSFYGVSKDDVQGNFKDTSLQTRRIRKGLKRVHRGSVQGVIGGTSTSSESEEEEEQNEGVYLGSLSVAETPEERKRRENRSRRFDRGKDMNRGSKGFGRGRITNGGIASTRRSAVLQMALNSGDSQNGRAVEDIDWDSLTVRGTCQEVEKRYLRLTSAPDPHMVRPEEILRKALAMVQTTTKNYLYRCEQLKSIRQDLTVQRIRNELTVQVYETHARMALEAGDLPEYNQCQSQLQGLYAEGIKGCCSEFASYGLLYIVFQHGNSRDLLSAMARLTREGKKDKAVKHALAVRSAVAVGNYTAFFRLYRTAPNLSPYLMDLHVEKMRFEAVKCMARSYRPTVPVSFMARTLGFTDMSGGEGDLQGLEECEDWLRGHGSHVQIESGTNELVMDAKMSATSLFMPEPEDAVPHGDANLALNDFFGRS
ncbi:unnamed protein product [Sphagnum compactum]